MSSLVVATINYIALISDDGNLSYLDQHRKDRKYSTVIPFQDGLLVALGGANLCDLLYYDSSFSSHHIMRIPNAAEPHSLTPYRDDIIITSTATNELIFVDPATSTIKKRWLHGDRKADTTHLNDVLVHNGNLFLTHHNRNKPSFIEKYAPGLRGPIRTWTVGRQIHSPFVLNGVLHIFSSQEGTILRVDTGEVIASPGVYTRGIAFWNDRYVVGLSDLGDRSIRSTLSGKLLFYDPTFRRIDGSILLPKCGQVGALTVIGQ